MPPASDRRSEVARSSDRPDGVSARQPRTSPPTLGGGAHCSLRVQQRAPLVAARQSVAASFRGALASARHLGYAHAPLLCVLGQNPSLQLGSAASQTCPP